MLHAHHVRSLAVFMIIAAVCFPERTLAITWQTKSDMLTHRTCLAAAVANNKAYALGGYLLASAEVFQPVTNSWEFIAPMPVVRYFHGAAGYDGKVYVMGGQWTNWMNMGEHVLDWLTRCAPANIYDPETNTWSVGSTMAKPRTCVQAAELNGEIWVIGGIEDPDPSDFSTIPSNAVEIYNPEKNSWSAGPPLPAPRYNHAVVTLDGKLYVSGGVKDSSSLPPYYEESATMFVTSGKGWTQLSNMPYRRKGHAMAGIHGRLYIMGGDYIQSQDGQSSSWSVTGNVIEYDPATDTYTESQSLAGERWYHAAAQASATIYVFGGSDDGNYSSAGNILDSTEGGEPPSCGTLLDLGVTTTGAGKVYSSPGIDCGEDCLEKFCPGTPVTLNAVSEKGWKFQQWTGACSGSDPECEVTMDSELQVGAVFIKTSSSLPGTLLMLRLSPGD